MHKPISTDTRTSSSRFQEHYLCLASYNEILGIMDSQIETAEQAEMAERERLIGIILRRQQEEQDIWQASIRGVRPINKK